MKPYTPARAYDCLLLSRDRSLAASIRNNSAMALPVKTGLRWMLAAFVATLSFTASGNGPQVGKPAPALTLSKVLQAPVDAKATWDALRGNVVVIDFWATWCVPCRKSIPHWNQLVDEFKGKPVQFIAITDENEQLVASFLKQTPIHSWVGVEGLGQLTREQYGIEGIPTTVLVNQKGVVVAVAHPARLELKDIQEVIDTGQSSLPPAVELDSGAGPNEEAEIIPASRPVFEVSVRRSGPLPPGRGFDSWQTWPTNADAMGRYATVKKAILTLFDCHEALLDCRTSLPTEWHDFTVQLPPGANRADRERAVAPMFRSVFSLDVHRVQAEREVYILKVASTNAPGLTLSEPNSRGGGGTERGSLKLGRAKIDWLLGYLEQWMQKPVLNETGLTNRYDIRLGWEMSKRELEDNAAMPDPESIRTAIRNQLGLGLSFERRSVPVVIVEKAQ
jgi:uncharacterized protein (TIGR03435 family)